YDGYSGGRLRWGDTVKSVSGYSATGNYFDLLGVQPELGRFFHEADVRGPNSAPCMVFSDSLWRRPATVSRHGAICLAGLLDTRCEPLRRGVPAGSDGPSFDGAWPAQTRRDAPAGYGKSQFDRGAVGEGVSKDGHRSAAAADPSRTLC